MSQDQAARGFTGTHGGMTRDDVVAMFARRDRAYDALDAAALAADYADDVVIVSPTAGTHTGVVAAEGMLRGIFEALDPDVKTLSLLIDGDQVAQVMQIEGANLGSLFGMPASGKTFSLTAVFLYDLRDGKIVREHRIYDFTGLLVTIGVLKAKPA